MKCTKKAPNCGVFILSLDISSERQLAEIPNYTFSKEKLKTAANSLLAVLSENKIPATWALTGELLLDFCQRSGMSCSSSIIAPESSISSRQYYGNSLFFDDALKRILSGEGNHEIGYHSFSHPSFSEIEENVVDFEIKAGFELARCLGIEFRSFVFPKNRIAHVDILKKYGFRIYRGETLRKDFRSHRLGKLSNSINEIVAPPVVPDWKNGIWNIPSSMYFVDTNHPWSLLPRAKIGLWRAIRSKKVFHIWLHHWNFLEYDSLFKDFEFFMKYVSEKRKDKKVEVMTMGDFADSLGVGICSKDL